MSEHSPQQNPAELLPLPPVDQQSDLEAQRHARVIDNLDEYTRAARLSILRVSKSLPLTDVEDLIQETLERAVKKVPIQEESSAGWVYRVAQNATYDQLRQENRMPIESVDPQEGTFGLVRTAPSAESEAFGSGNVLFEIIGNAIRERFGGNEQPEQAEIYYKILLLKTQKVPDKEIAAQLDINYMTVRTRMHRMRKALRPIVDAYLAGEDTASKY